MNGARLLVDTLKAAGVERLFTLSGNQILSIYDACLDVGIAVTDTRHEAAAAHMADAWARLRDRPGVCLVSAGPGHTNALTGVANALLSESPVLWLSGGSDLATLGRGGFQEMDQAGLARPVCKAAWTVERAEAIPAIVARAWQIMMADPPGPVHLTLPADVLAQSVTLPTTMITGSGADTSLDERRPAPTPVEPGAIEQAQALLAGARRPLILAGPAAGRGALGRLLTTLAERTGIPTFVVESPRGLNDPAWHAAGRLFSEVDCLVLLAPVDFAVGFIGPSLLAPAASLIHVAPTADAIDRRHPATLGLVGDRAGSIARLLAGHHAPRQDWSEWAARLAVEQAMARRRVDAAETRTAPLHPLVLAATVGEMLPEDAIVAIDGGEFSQWARWAMGIGPQTCLLNGKFGMIGPAIPFAIGAALARPGSKVVAFLGDGTFGFHAMEFDTAVRHKVPFVAIIGNDAGWAAERHRQRRLYGLERLVAADLLPTRYDQVVAALGGHGEFVERPEQLRPALERALASERPACVNVMIASIPSPAAF